MADDLGYETIGANGGTSYKTPVLDRLAERGVRFEQCYAQPLCTPSRVKIMTGIYNVRNYVKFGFLDPGETTFAHLLKRAGYATCVVGKWQLKGGFDGPGHFGFDEYCLWQLTRRPGRYPNPGLETGGKQVDYTGGEYGPDVVSDYACDFIRRHKRGPFLVYYPMILTHCPFEPTPDSPDWDPKSKGSKNYKGDAKYFGDMVTHMDKIVGKILATLDEAGLRENTLVLFTGDKGGRVCTDLVDFSDVLPTLCEAAGATVPQKRNIDGRSFLPQVQGRKGDPRKWIYCWYARGGKAKAAKVFARNRQYKLYASGQFYDVREDPIENHPLKAGALADDAARARDLLQSALDRYKDARPQRLR